MSGERPKEPQVIQQRKKIKKCPICGAPAVFEGIWIYAGTHPRPHPAPAEETSLAELSEINAALLKLYPDDFALQLNARQLTQVQKEHNAAIARKAREDVLKRFESLAEKKWFSVDVGDPDGNCCVVATDDIEKEIESLRAQEHPSAGGGEHR